MKAVAAAVAAAAIAAMLVAPGARPSIEPAPEAADLVNLGTGTTINAVSSNGQFVGQMTVNGATHAFSWTSADGLVDIGLRDDAYASLATAVNARGDVAGISILPSGETEAFVWSKTGGYVPIGTLPGAFRPNAISESGQVVGMYGVGYPRAFSWTPESGLIDIGTLGGPYANAADVNARGEVVGWADTRPGETHAFLWTAGGGMVDLGTLGGAGTFGGQLSAATAINEDGQVVGQSRTVSGTVDAFSWTAAGGMVDIAPYSFATAVSNSGQVIGYLGGGAFSWTSLGGVQTVGVRDTRPAAVSDTGVVIGMTPSASGWDAFAWTVNAGMVHLKNLPGGTYSGALAVAADGRIFGFGWVPGEQHAVMWRLGDTTPPDAPTSPDLNAASDTGASQSDDITQSTLLAFGGTAEPGATVTLFRDDVAVRTTLADAISGAWTTTDGPLSDGTYVYSATATDGAGNTSPHSAAVDVTIDTVPPTIRVPDAAVTADATSPDGAVVDYVVDAVDPPSSSLPVSCLPERGSIFAIGTTTVYCDAADAAGNTATALFGVYVRGAIDQLADLWSVVNGLQPGDSLAQKARNARLALLNGNRQDAVLLLRSFLSETTAQSGKKLDASTAATLTDAVNRIIAVIG